MRPAGIKALKDHRASGQTSWWELPFVTYLVPSMLPLLCQYLSDPLHAGSHSCLSGVSCRNMIGTTQVSDDR